jgi:Ni,Fe-hydrogenase maturation factor
MYKMKTIYVLGNPEFEQDSSPVKLIPKLQTSLPQYNFQHLDPTENLPEEPHLILIDTILGLKSVRTLNETELDKIQSSPQVSMHDFDLGFQLKLMKKLDKIQKVTIIGIPDLIKDPKEILRQVTQILTVIASQDQDTSGHKPY